MTPESVDLFDNGRVYHTDEERAAKSRELVAALELADVVTDAVGRPQLLEPLPLNLKDAQKEQ